MTTQPPDPNELFNKRPPPPGYGAQITSQGGVEIGRNLICHKCFALVPDDAFGVDRHNEWHRVNEEMLSKMLDAIEALEKRFVIEEE